MRVCGRMTHDSSVKRTGSIHPGRCFDVRSHPFSDFLPFSHQTVTYQMCDRRPWTCSEPEVAGSVAHNHVVQCCASPQFTSLTTKPTRNRHVESRCLYYQLIPHRTTLVLELASRLSNRNRNFPGKGLEPMHSSVLKGQEMRSFTATSKVTVGSLCEFKVWSQQIAHQRR
jgi:hypothetical protein